jgi:hypothetical protein
VLPQVAAIAVTIATGVALADLLVGFGAVDTASGAVIIVPPVDGSVFTARTAVATILVGGIVFFTVSTFKRSMPFQFGVWGAEFGAEIIAVSTALKIVWIAIALAGLLTV